MHEDHDVHNVHNVNINCSIIYCSLWCMVVDKAYNTVLL